MQSRSRFLDHPIRVRNCPEATFPIQATGVARRRFSHVITHQNAERLKCDLCAESHPLHLQWKRPISTVRNAGKLRAKAALTLDLSPISQHCTYIAFNRPSGIASRVDVPVFTIHGLYTVSHRSNTKTKFLTIWHEVVWHNQNYIPFKDVFKSLLIDKKNLRVVNTGTPNL